MKEPDRIDINPSPKNTAQEAAKSSAGANKRGETESFLAKHNNKNKSLKWRSEKQERLKVILIFDSKAWALEKKKWECNFPD